MPSRSSPSRVLALAAPAPGHEDRARDQPGRHRGLAGARPSASRWSRVDFAFAAAPTRTRADKPGVANMVAGAARRRRRPARRQGVPATGSNARRSSSASGRPRLFPRHRCARSSENRDEAFDLLRLALTQPRFDADAVERMRAQIMAALRRETTEPERHRQPHLVGGRVSRPSLRPADQRHAGNRCRRITADDLQDLHAAACSRASNLKIARGRRHRRRRPLGPLLDRMFGGLPAKASSSRSRRRAAGARPAHRDRSSTCRKRS